ncbi:hypothetical protein B0E46_17150 [Rhodanobacter sp. B04]|uniref:hypothetical protein n=1 Tax=Rhodanobacter sp. B04 TaxID=1945860 RepID=UPI000986173B|nr:hypothetical protein [Rhodanobacter sp. B04]OOG60962.1 hypothetical protein B0E46_17150 [Rhodanobacter sp. B04]
MSNQVECTATGRSQHGSIFGHPLDNPAFLLRAIRTFDGSARTAAARRVLLRGMCARCVLLHPSATGRQLLPMLAWAN